MIRSAVSFFICALFTVCGPYVTGLTGNECMAQDDSYREQRKEEKAAKREMMDDEDREFDNGMQPPTEDYEADHNSREEKIEERTAKKEMSDDEDLEADKGDQKEF